MPRACVAEDASRYAATLRIHPGGRHHRRCQEHAAHQTVDTVLRPQRPQGHPPLTCQQRDAAQYQPELRHILQRQKVRPIRIEGFHFREFEYQAKNAQCDKEIISNLSGRTLRSTNNAGRRPQAANAGSNASRERINFIIV